MRGTETDHDVQTVLETARKRAKCILQINLHNDMIRIGRGILAEEFHEQLRSSGQRRLQIRNTLGHIPDEQGTPTVPIKIASTKRLWKMSEVVCFALLFLFDRFSPAILCPPALEGRQGNCCPACSMGCCTARADSHQEQIRLIT